MKMFITHPRPKKTLLAPPKKRKATHAIEEIAFDNDARAEYLTGFHKRKQARIKQAQEIAAQKARQERIDLRKQIRDDRKREVEEHVEQFNAMMREAQKAGHDESGDDGSNDSNGDGWGGFEDAPAAASAALEPIDLEAEYIDEDKFTTVTIESVNIDRDGLHKPEEERDDDDEEGDDEDADDADGTRQGGRETEEKKKQPGPKKPKKKKFRYESKVERRLTAAKQRRSRR